MKCILRASVPWLPRFADLFNKIGHSRPLFHYFRLFITVDSKCSIQSATNDWIPTVDLWNRKHPFYQLSHNHWPCSADLWVVLLLTNIRLQYEILKSSRKLNFVESTLNTKEKIFRVSFAVANMAALWYSKNTFRCKEVVKFNRQWTTARK